jgi:hypothetical protein
MHAFPLDLRPAVVNARAETPCQNLVVQVVVRLRLQGPQNPEHGSAVLHFQRCAAPSVRATALRLPYIPICADFCTSVALLPPKPRFDSLLRRCSAMGAPRGTEHPTTGYRADGSGGPAAADTRAVARTYPRPRQVARGLARSGCSLTLDEQHQRRQRAAH